MYLESDEKQQGIPQGPKVDQSGEAPHQLKRLRSVMLLAGSVRATNLRKATDRYVMDLPIDDKRTLLDSWHDHLDDLAFELGLDHLPARVMIDQPANGRQVAERPGPAEVKIQRDPGAFRGTGGLVSDLAKDYDDDDYLIVANAAQILLTPLPRLVEAMARKQADAALLCDRDNRPSGMTLIRCGVLRDIAPVGFVDLNEQALPQIAKHHSVKVCRFDQPAGIRVRTRQDYLSALRIHHTRLQGGCRLADGFPDEDWHAAFSIVEPGANVDPSAVIHDSVVLAGGRVEAGAVLVRSIVAPNGWIPAGESVVECVVASHRRPKAG